MNSSIKALFPIGLILVIVFGITYLSNNSGNAPDTPKEPSKVLTKSNAPPLLFGVMTAEPDPNHSFLKYMRLDWEVGEEGHYDFWFHNVHEQPVSISLRGKTCTCAGAKVAQVSPESLKTALQYSIVGSLLPNLSLGMLPCVNLELTQKLNWETLAIDNDADKKQVAPAKDGLPQLRVFRVTFSGKQPGDPRRIGADLLTQLPGTVPMLRQFSVATRTTASFNFYLPNTPAGTGLEMGDIQPLRSTTRVVYFVSTTRPELDLKTSWNNPNDAHPAIQFSKIEEVTGSDLNEISKQIYTEIPLGISQIRCVYKMSVTVFDRAEVMDGDKKVTKRMDLGPFEKILIVSHGDASTNNSQRMLIRGIVRGEVAVIGANDERDRIDFGKTINSRTGATREVQIVSQLAGLDVELVNDLTDPPYLETKLTPKSEEGGRKTWTLWVKIPAEKLNGSLPRSSAIYLQTKDASKQRIRVPVLGSSLDGPSF